MYLMHIKRATGYFSLSASGSCGVSAPFPIPCPAATTSNIVIRFAPSFISTASKYRRPPFSRTVFYGRLLARKRNAANVTDYLSGKGKRRRKNTFRGEETRLAGRRKGVRAYAEGRGRQAGAEPTRNTNYNALRTMALNLLDALFRSLNSIKSGNEVCRRVSRPPTLVFA